MSACYGENAVLLVSQDKCCRRFLCLQANMIESIRLLVSTRSLQSGVYLVELIQTRLLLMQVGIAKNLLSGIIP